jgi:hypothetical protein
MTIYLSLLVCLVGLVIFAIASEGTARSKMATIGKDMFWVGLLAFLMKVAGAVSVGR